MDNAAVDICVQVSARTYVFISLEYISRTGIAESYGNPLFNHLRKCYTVFQSS